MTTNTNELQTDEQTETSETSLSTIIGALKVKIDAANAQILHLGLLVEYLYKELDDKSIGLNLDGYPDWAQTRFQEIQEMTSDPASEDLKKEMIREMEEIAKNIKLD